VFYIAYILAGVKVAPNWPSLLGELGRPRGPVTTEYLVMLTGLVGTTIAPWMQFYQQASIVEKGVRIEEYRYSRWDVILGSVMVTVVAFFIIVTCAETLHRSGVRIETAKDAALALAPIAGRYNAYLFAFGLLNASLFAASILPLSTAYTVCEGMGWEVGVDKHLTAPRSSGSTRGDCPEERWSLPAGPADADHAIVQVINECCPRSSSSSCSVDQRPGLRGARKLRRSTGSRGRPRSSDRPHRPPGGGDRLPRTSGNARLVGIYIFRRFFLEAGGRRRSTTSSTVTTPRRRFSPSMTGKASRLYLEISAATVS
jgi:hypothetical protein